MTILCIDFGLKRIGVAVGSTDSGLAFARDVLSNDRHLIEHLDALIKLEVVEKILVGLPLKRDRSAGDIDQELQKFALQLKKRFSLPIEMVDERYTSKIAAKKLHAIQMKAKKQKKTLDSVAAQLMLQDWLETTVLR